jgi:predicted esterase
VQFGREAKRVLEDAGLDVTWRESPMMHGVDPAYLAELEDWVSEALPEY